MSNTTQTSLMLWALSGALAGCMSELDAADEGADGDVETLAALASNQAVLRPVSDVSKLDVVGVGDATNLYRNVDDGTAFGASDGATTVVRATTGAALTRHAVGYAGAPAGTVTVVKVHYRARRSSSAGTARIKLYDGATLVATGAPRTLTDTWTSFEESFTGLSVSDANRLVSEIEFSNTLKTGSHRYTIVWLTVTYADGSGSGGPVGEPFVPYSADSFFRKAVPASAPIDSESAQGITFVKNHPEQTAPYPLINGLGSNNWGTVYFKGTCTDPIWKLTGTVPSKVAFLTTEGFHAPAELGSTFTGTSDSPFVVMDTCGVPSMPKGFSVWAANAVKGSGTTVNVSAAGAYQHDSNGLDYRNPRSSSTKNMRSRGAIPDSMVIRKDRLEWAMANNTGLGYALHMFWVETSTAAGFVHPMVGDENDKLGWGPEGIRIRIKPSVDLTKRGLSPGALVIARTLQTHGAYLGDNSGSGSALKAEQDHGQWGSLLTRDSLKGLTWDDFEFVQRGYEP
ncbi:MAG: hypothetical protein H0X17_00155 [Deltaproteobacteria bacterium]|nr:hypothetical protein [Deltaproteobacteria bacterium]